MSAGRVKRVVRCSRLVRVKGFPGCCESCHEDEEEYGYAMCSHQGRRREYEVCCKVATWLNERVSDERGVKEKAP